MINYDAWLDRIRKYQDGIVLMNEAIQKLNGGDKQMSNQVMQQQFFLNCFGCNAGTVDGIFGKRTQAAKEAFYALIPKEEWWKVERTPFNIALRQYAEQKLPRHLIVAAQYLGEKEIPGSKHNNIIVGWLRAMAAWINDDETPWCSAYERRIILETKYKGIDEKYLKKCRVTLAAQSWEGYGYTSNGYLGDIAVFWRGHKESMKGHVGFIVGKNENGDYWILGGNQGDPTDKKSKGVVSVSLIERKRLKSFRTADAKLNGLNIPIPLITARAEASTNEA